MTQPPSQSKNVSNNESDSSLLTLSLRERLYLNENKYASRNSFTVLKPQPRYPQVMPTTSIASSTNVYNEQSASVQFKQSVPYSYQPKTFREVEQFKQNILNRSSCITSNDLNISSSFCKPEFSSSGDAALSRVDDLKAQISTLENGLGELKITVTDMLDNQMKLMKNVESLCSAISTLKDDYKATKDGINTLNNNSNKIETHLGKQVVENSKILLVISREFDKLKDVSEKTGLMENSLKLMIEKKLASNMQTVKDFHMTKFGSIERSLSSIEELILNNQETIEEISEAVKKPLIKQTKSWNQRIAINNRRRSRRASKKIGFSRKGRPLTYPCSNPFDSPVFCVEREPYFYDDTDDNYDIIEVNTASFEPSTQSYTKTRSRTRRRKPDANFPNSDLTSKPSFKYIKSQDDEIMIEL